MTSNRPYLIRALYEWIADNDMTPHLLVDAEQPGVVVPRAYVADGRIVLNVAASAVQSLVLGNDAILFSARFGGQSFPVELPVAAVLVSMLVKTATACCFPSRMLRPPSPLILQILSQGQQPLTTIKAHQMALTTRLSALHSGL